MTPIAALAAENQRLREALEAMLDVPALLDSAAACEHRDIADSLQNRAAMAIGDARDALSTAPPTAEQIQEWERHAEIGRQINELRHGSSLLRWDETERVCTLTLKSFPNDDAKQWMEKVGAMIQESRAALGGET